MKIDPATTHAIVVGIERYKVKKWDLSGPAADAVRFARWLIEDRKVPPEQVTFLVSALPGANQQEVDECVGELNISAKLDPTSSNLDDLFNDRLPDKTGAFLFIYWSGHGVIHKNGERMLFCSDATEATKRNISARDLLHYLQSKSIKSFDKQMVLIDACANFFTEMNSKLEPPQQGFNKGDQKSASLLEQFVLYSAAQGQIALNNKIERYGEFSHVALEWLKMHHPWPPDFEKLSDHVWAAFEELRSKGKTRQTPVYTWKSSPRGERKVGDFPISNIACEAAKQLGLSSSQICHLAEVIGDLPPVQDNRTAREKLIQELPANVTNEIKRADTAAEDMLNIVTASLQTRQMPILLEELEKMATSESEKILVGEARIVWLNQYRVAPVVPYLAQVTTRDVRSAYLLSVPDKQSVKIPGDLDDALESLADLPKRSDGIAPLHEFVVRLENIVNIKVPDKWFELAQDALSGLRARVKRETATPRLYHLSIDLRGDQFKVGSNRWPEQVVGRIRSADGEWSKRMEISCKSNLISVQAAVAQLVDSIRSEFGPEFKIGFIVPRTLYSANPERWLAGEDAMSEGTELCRAHPVVLNCAERLGSDQAEPLWRKKIKNLKSSLEFGGTAEVLWIAREMAADSVGLRDSVRENNAKPCLGLAFVPELEANLTAFRKDPLIAALAEGAPFIIWLDSEPKNWTEIRGRAEQLVQKGQFNGLPERVQKLRMTRDADLKFFAGALRILWDDPIDIYPEANFALNTEETQK